MATDLIERRTSRQVLEDLCKEFSCNRKIGRFEKLEYKIPQYLSFKMYLLCIEIDLRKKFYEECPEGYEVDHIIPRSKGGSDSLENLQWLLKRWNREKNKTIINDDFEFPHCVVNIEQKILEKRKKRSRFLRDKMYELEKFIGGDHLALNEFLSYFSSKKIEEMRKKNEQEFN